MNGVIVDYSLHSSDVEMYGLHFEVLFLSSNLLLATCFSRGYLSGYDNCLIVEYPSFSNLYNYVIYVLKSSSSSLFEVLSTRFSSSLPGCYAIFRGSLLSPSK